MGIHPCRVYRSEQVISGICKIQVLVLVGAMSIPFGFAQKVKVGYDKSVDFSRYRTYTIQHPAAPSPRPLLYANIVGAIQEELQAKGLAGTENDGDLTLILAGGLDYGLNSVTSVTSDSCANCKAPLLDPKEWTGKTAPPGSSGKPMPDGMVELNFIDRAANKVVWTGIVTQKLDTGKKEKSLQKISAAIQKLLTEFPPRK